MLCYFLKKRSSNTVCLNLQVHSPFQMQRRWYCSLVIFLEYILTIHRLHVERTSSQSAGGLMADLLVSVGVIKFGAGPWCDYCNNVSRSLPKRAPNIQAHLFSWACHAQIAGYASNLKPLNADQTTHFLEFSVASWTVWASFCKDRRKIFAWLLNSSASDWLPSHPGLP